jgi:hypothetical protein
METQRPQKPDPSTGAPLPPRDLRPEDVVFAEMDDSIGGIIIPGLPNPSRRKVEPVKDEPPPEA